MTQKAIVDIRFRPGAGEPFLSNRPKRVARYAKHVVTRKMRSTEVKCNGAMRRWSMAPQATCKLIEGSGHKGSKTVFANFRENRVKDLHC